jgi:hypothetical protein
MALAQYTPPHVPTGLANGLAHYNPFRRPVQRENLPRIPSVARKPRLCFQTAKARSNRGLRLYNQLTRYIRLEHSLPFFMFVWGYLQVAQASAVSRLTWQSGAKRNRWAHS